VLLLVESPLYWGRWSQKWQEQCCRIKHAQEHGANFVTKTRWDKLHFCVKCCYVSSLVNKI
jgi:hypothetical protein